MTRQTLFTWAGLLAALSCASVAYAYSVPKDKWDGQKVFFGTLETFESPGEVDFSAVVKETPEYQKVKKKNVERGTGEYWILMDKASSRARKAVTDFGENSTYDLLVATGYFQSIEHEVEPEDVTEQIVTAMAEEEAD